MTVSDHPPVLADAADVLSDQLRLQMRRMGAELAPYAARLEKRFETLLKRRGLDNRIRQALIAITPAAVARVLAEGRSTGSLFEQVEYYGRRLAKLNVAPSLVVAALADYDALLEPVLKKLPASDRENFQWVREQLQFCIVLTLNNAYYQVRETETEAFYDLYRVELESRNLEELLRRFLATLTRFCRADAAAVYWRDSEGTAAGSGQATWKRLAAVAGRSNARTAVIEADEASLNQPRCWIWSSPRTAAAATTLDASWAARYRSCWSVPLMAGRRVAGVMQFAFSKTYEWLPREQELLASAAERCQLGAEKARLMEDLAQREEQIRSLAGRMMQVEEAERRRISRELHDEAGQSLLCVRLQLEMVEQALPEDQTGLRQRLGAARAETEKTILEIRRLLAALSPAVLEQLGLAAALRQLVARFRQMHPARVQLHVGRLNGVPTQTANIVYRLVQECCNNIAKHSMASTVKLSASTADQMFRLLVEDDGIGFSVEDALEKRNSYGLSGIRERVALMGGRFSIESWPGRPLKSNKRRTRQGTRIQIELPIATQQHQARSLNLKNVG